MAGQRATAEARFGGPPARFAEALLFVGILFVLAARVTSSGPEGERTPDGGVVHLVDVNTSPWHELVHLPGIGEARAREIVRNRRRHGPFRSLNDLCRVRGIGPATVRRIAAFLAECEHGRDHRQEGTR
jgi:competence ComEA-like helix-hairpin-helix protein